MGQMMSSFLEQYLKIDGAAKLSCESFNLRETNSLQSTDDKCCTCRAPEVADVNMTFDWPIHDDVSSGSGSGLFAGYDGLSSGSSKATPESIPSGQETWLSALVGKPVLDYQVEAVKENGRGEEMNGFFEACGGIGNDVLQIG